MENIQKIVESVMGGKVVRIEIESMKDHEIWSFVGSLKKLNPELRTNCNVTTLPENVMRATVDLSLTVNEEWVRNSLLDALQRTILAIEIKS